jgi:predicted RNase H-like HicB family nuclease
MKLAHRLTAILEREDEGFVALCPELDIASEGASIEARVNLVEALTLFFETPLRPKSPGVFMARFS